LAEKEKQLEDIKKSIVAKKEQIREFGKYRALIELRYNQKLTAI